VHADGRRITARTASAVAIVATLLAGCGAGAGPSTAATALPSPPARGVSLILAVGDDPYAKAVVSGARTEAARAGVRLAVYDSATLQAQREQLYAAIQRQDQAVILAPTEYLNAYLLLRTAHDRSVPTFVLDVDPPPATNQAYVWSFLTSGRRAAAVEAARVLAARMRGSTGPVLVASSEGSAPGPAEAAQAELRRLLPRAAVRPVVLPMSSTGAALGPELPGAGGVLATDERAAALLIDAVAGRAPRRPFVAVGASSGEVAGLRRGDVDVLVAPRPAQLGARAVHFTVVAAALNPRLVPRTVSLDAVTLTRANVDAAGRQATYP
jgi:ABC-type sugar transport system substrate-binding protein